MNNLIPTIIQTEDEARQWTEIILLETCEHTIARWHRTGLLEDD